MKHPDITQWADYARTLDSAEQREALRAHLDDGCGLCEATLAAFERISETSIADRELAPPPGALRSVKAFFSTQHPGASGFWIELKARTTFDSALAPMVSGSRSPGADNRHLLFESDRYTVELSLDFDADTVDTVLRGQILEAPGRPRSHTPVFLVGRGEVLGRAISAPQGTFEMTGPIDRPCELWVFPDDENRIRLMLPNGS